MMQNPIYLSNEAYQLLTKRAHLLHKTLDQVAETILVQEFTLLDVEDEAEVFASEEEEIQDALAALDRLSTLFVDNKVPFMEDILTDILE